VTLQAKAQHLAGVGVVIHHEYERRRASRAEHKEMGLSWDRESGTGRIDPSRRDELMMFCLEQELHIAPATVALVHLVFMVSAYRHARRAQFNRAQAATGRS